MPEIHRFRIEKLFGFLDVDIPIKDNRIILVGVNGLGKSTILTMLYHIISGQVYKLRNTDFISATLLIDEKEFSFKRDELVLEVQRRRIWSRFPPHIRKAIRDNLKNPTIMQFVSSHGMIPSAQLHDIASLLDVSESTVNRIKHELRRARMEDVGDDLFSDTKDMSTRIKDMQAVIGSVVEKVSFWPTYRRIEKDLEDLLPFAGEDRLENISEALTEARKERDSVAGEIIEFGMEDVQSKINSIMANLKDVAHTNFKKLAGSIFKQIVNPTAPEEMVEYSDEIKKIQFLNRVDIERILNRVEDESFSGGEKTAIAHKINKIVETQASYDAIDPMDRLVVHFFAELANIDELLTGKEASIVNFTNTCNSYLEESSKAIQYDKQSYQIKIDWYGKKTVALKELSSGEKQIVSIFSHLYLSPTERFAFIIDEPELSLSLSWQKRFLVDVVNTGRCSFLASVTHSPFIFQNELDAYATDIREFCNDA